MRTGKHTVRDVYCGVCDEILGWRYVSTRALTSFRPLLCRFALCWSSSGAQHFVTESADAQDYAFVLDQKYKEGKFILECELISERPESKARDPVFRPRIEEIVRDQTRADAAALAQQIPILNRG